MKISNTIGIDVSKLTLDVVINGNEIHFKEFNDPKTFKAMIKRILKASEAKLEQLLFCFEHTGVYSLALASFLNEQGIKFVMVPGLEVKRSLGIQRGKSDKVDARSLAKYAYRLREELEPTQLPSETLLALKNYLTLRRNLVKHRATYLKLSGEFKQFTTISKQDIFFKSQERIIRSLTKEIDAIEQTIKELIDNDPSMRELYLLVTSVKGVGLILGVNLIVTTHCFQRFKKWRQYACYCGTAPFPYQSGTSIQGRDRVHPFANKAMKSLLNQAAMTARQHDPELKIFYEKQVKRGKNKMSAMNALRNKIIARVFAVVARKTPYVTLKKYAA